MEERFNKIQFALNQVEAKEREHHNIKRDREFIDIKPQFGEYCRNFYSHPISYNTEECSKLMNDISICDFFN